MPVTIKLPQYVPPPEPAPIVPAPRPTQPELVQTGEFLGGVPVVRSQVPVPVEDQIARLFGTAQAPASVPAPVQNPNFVLDGYRTALQTFTANHPDAVKALPRLAAVGQKLNGSRDEVLYFFDAVLADPEYSANRQDIIDTLTDTGLTDDELATKVQQLWNATNASDERDPTQQYSYHRKYKVPKLKAGANEEVAFSLFDKAALTAQSAAVAAPAEVAKMVGGLGRMAKDSVAPQPVNTSQPLTVVRNAAGEAIGLSYDPALEQPEPELNILKEMFAPTIGAVGAVLDDTYTQVGVETAKALRTDEEEALYQAKGRIPLVTTAAETLAKMAPIVAAAPFGPTLPAIIGGVQEAANQKIAGKNNETALARGAVIAAMSRIIPGGAEFLKRTAGKAKIPTALPAQTALGRAGQYTLPVVKEGVLEAGEEVSADAIADVAEATINGYPVKKFLQENSLNPAQLFETLVVSLIAGGAFQAAAIPTAMEANRKARAAVTKSTAAAKPSALQELAEATVNQDPVPEPEPEVQAPTPEAAAAVASEAYNALVELQKTNPEAFNEYAKANPLVASLFEVESLDTGAEANKLWQKRGGGESTREQEVADYEQAAARVDKAKAAAEAIDAEAVKDSTAPDRLQRLKIKDTPYMREVVGRVEARMLRKGLDVNDDTAFTTEFDSIIGRVPTAQTKATDAPAAAPKIQEPSPAAAPKSEKTGGSAPLKTKAKAVNALRNIADVKDFDPATRIQLEEYFGTKDLAEVKSIIEEYDNTVPRNASGRAAQPLAVYLNSRRKGKPVAEAIQPVKKSSTEGRDVETRTLPEVEDNPELRKEIITKATTNKRLAAVKSVLGKQLTDAADIATAVTEAKKQVQEAGGLLTEEMTDRLDELLDASDSKANRNRIATVLRQALPAGAAKFTAGEAPTSRIDELREEIAQYEAIPESDRSDFVQDGLVRAKVALAKLTKRDRAATYKQRLKEFEGVKETPYIARQKEMFRRRIAEAEGRKQERATRKEVRATRKAEGLLRKRKDVKAVEVGDTVTVELKTGRGTVVNAQAKVVAISDTGAPMVAMRRTRGVIRGPIEVFVLGPRGATFWPVRGGAVNAFYVGGQWSQNRALGDPITFNTEADLNSFVARNKAVANEVQATADQVAEMVSGGSATVQAPKGISQAIESLRKLMAEVDVILASVPNWSVTYPGILSRYLMAVDVMGKLDNRKGDKNIKPVRLVRNVTGWLQSIKDDLGFRIEWAKVSPTTPVQLEGKEVTLKSLADMVTATEETVTPELVARVLSTELGNSPEVDVAIEKVIALLYKAPDTPAEQVAKETVSKGKGKSAIDAAINRALKGAARLYDQGGEHYLRDELDQAINKAIVDHLPNPTPESVKAERARLVEVVEAKVVELTGTTYQTKDLWTQAVDEAKEFAKANQSEVQELSKDVVNLFGSDPTKVIPASSVTDPVISATLTLMADAGIIGYTNGMFHSKENTNVAPSASKPVTQNRPTFARKSAHTGEDIDIGARAIDYIHSQGSKSLEENPAFNWDPKVPKYIKTGKGYSIVRNTLANELGKLVDSDKATSFKTGQELVDQLIEAGKLIQNPDSKNEVALVSLYNLNVLRKRDGEKSQEFKRILKVDEMDASEAELLAKERAMERAAQKRIDEARARGKDISYGGKTVSGRGEQSTDKTFDTRIADTATKLISYARAKGDSMTMEEATDLIVVVNHHKYAREYVPREALPEFDAVLKEVKARYDERTRLSSTGRQTIVDMRPPKRGELSTELRQIESILQAKGVPIKFVKFTDPAVSRETHGVYNALTQTMYINMDRSIQEAVPIIAHELVHFGLDQFFDVPTLLAIVQKEMGPAAWARFTATVKKLKSEYSKSLNVKLEEQIADAGALVEAVNHSLTKLIDSVKAGKSRTLTSALRNWVSNAAEILFDLKNRLFAKNRATPRAEKTLLVTADVVLKYTIDMLNGANVYASVTMPDAVTRPVKIYRNVFEAVRARSGRPLADPATVPEALGKFNPVRADKQTAEQIEESVNKFITDSGFTAENYAPWLEYMEHAAANNRVLNRDETLALRRLMTSSILYLEQTGQDTSVFINRVNAAFGKLKSFAGASLAAHRNIATDLSDGIRLSSAAVLLTRPPKKLQRIMRELRGKGTAGVMKAAQLQVQWMKSAEYQRRLVRIIMLEPAYKAFIKVDAATGLYYLDGTAFDASMNNPIDLAVFVLNAQRADFNLFSAKGVGAVIQAMRYTAMLLSVPVMMNAMVGGAVMAAKVALVDYTMARAIRGDVVGVKAFWTALAKTATSLEPLRAAKQAFITEISPLGMDPDTVFGTYHNRTELPANKLTLPLRLSKKLLMSIDAFYVTLLQQAQYASLGIEAARDRLAGQTYSTRKLLAAARKEVRLAQADSSMPINHIMDRQRDEIAFRYTGVATRTAMALSNSGNPINDVFAFALMSFSTPFTRALDAGIQVAINYGVLGPVINAIQRLGFSQALTPLEKRELTNRMVVITILGLVYGYFTGDDDENPLNDRVLGAIADRIQNDPESFKTGTDTGAAPGALVINGHVIPLFQVPIVTALGSYKILMDYLRVELGVSKAPKVRPLAAVQAAATNLLSIPIRQLETVVDLLKVVLETTSERDWTTTSARALAAVANQYIPSQYRSIVRYKDGYMRNYAHVGEESKVVQALKVATPWNDALRYDNYGRPVSKLPGMPDVEHSELMLTVLSIFANNWKKLDITDAEAYRITYNITAEPDDRIRLPALPVDDWMTDRNMYADYTRLVGEAYYAALKDIPFADMQLEKEIAEKYFGEGTRGRFSSAAKMLLQGEIKRDAYDLIQEMEAYKIYTAGMVTTRMGRKYNRPKEVEINRTHNRINAFISRAKSTGVDISALRKMWESTKQKYPAQ